MPLTRFKLSAIEDGGIATADLADGSVTTAKIADSAVTSVKTSNLFTNTEIAGTEAARMPVGTTAQRANAQSGDIRFNSTLSLMEYYDGALWKAIDSPPTITSISPSTFTAAGDTITVSGTNFQSGVNASVISSDGTTYTPDSVTRASSSSITFDITTAIKNSGKDAFDVLVSNTSGLSVTSNDALTIPNPTAAFTSAAGAHAIFDSGRSGTFNGGVTLTGDVSESDVTLTYSVSAGSLPAGASLSTSTGAITGFSAVGSDTASNFTINANISDASEGTSVDVTRAFALTIKPPVVTSYTSTGSGTFTVPTGLTAVDVLVVAGGGGGGADNAGGGGAGGLIYRPAFPVTPGGSVSYTVGANGGGVPSHFQATPAAQNAPFAKGQNSAFGTLTAIGGGVGGSSDSSDSNNGGPGGSGGGGGSEGDKNGPGGTGVQPSQPGDSGTYGFGNNGGNGSTDPQNSGGGGGGAGGAGGNFQSGVLGGLGGIGKNYSISGSSVGYAGGGGGGNENTGAPNVGGVAQHGGGNGGGGFPGTYARAGTANRGGGGGGAGSPQTDATPYSYPTSNPSNANGGPGGSGIVVVKY